MAVWICAALEERLASGGEERIEEDAAVAHREAGEQAVGDGEDDVEAVAREESREAARHPAGLRQRRVRAARG